MALPTHAEVRAKVLFFLHRLVDSVGVPLLAAPGLPPTLAQLIDTARAESVIPVVELVNQLIIKCKSELAPLLETLFPALVQRMFACFDEYAHVRQPHGAPLPDAALAADKAALFKLHKVSRSPCHSLDLPLSYHL
jgi:hypothetical protein